MDKKLMREQLAALSPTEKIKILERLRDRSLSLARAGRRTKSTSIPTGSREAKDS